MRETAILTKLELRSLYGVNRFMHTRNPKEKRRGIGLLAVWALLAAVLFVYVGALVYGLCLIHLASAVPAFLTAMVSLVLLAFGIFRAGPVLFAPGNYELLCAMPLPERAIVGSRFLRLYAEDLLLTLAVMLPGVVAFGVCETPEPWFYLASALCVPFLPAIPLALSAVLGTLVMALSSRVKHKSLIQTALMIAVVLLVLFGSFGLTGVEEERLPQLLAMLARGVNGMIGQFYPPAAWVGEAVTGRDVGRLLLFMGVSALLAVLALGLAGRFFRRVMRWVMSVSAKQSFAMGHQKRRGLYRALWQREAKRYFASSVYVTNTIIGPILGCVLAGALLASGADAVLSLLPMDVRALIPFAYALVSCMMSTSSVSLSMEGKSFWAVQTLPISPRALLDGKLLFSLSLMLPFYLASEILLTTALRPGLAELLWLWLIPALLMLFSAVAGLAINLRFHSFDWEREEAVVKQSLSSMLGGFAGPLAALVMAAACLLIPSPITKPALCLALAGLTAWMYSRIGRIGLDTL